ncbi:hypothetical protein EIN_182440 [Entamoeba invadens IP1]|uniref:hypothetical protein n=1 Tax=Entamoeba invadens IP1 TaxID=370355 RepID=UPI0002C3DF50|nr:hypothetical protein EIN_182440 [Entamoeba invadens IP1]ELP94017.1 hypothetical protein EIN_182440 [Entamoeba invadens IP1]|eukprot:XP_004260788.1 hypothetical protein EIN_182440 [Entamoeba invadens IP1]
MRYICAVPFDFSGEEVVSSLTLAAYKIEWRVERAGRCYEEKCQQYINPSYSPSPSPLSSDVSISENDEKKAGDSDFSRKFKPHVKNIAKGDYYGLLGLGTVRYEATEDDIRQAYKKMCLIHHPDKNGGDDTMFKQLHEAYAILSSPDKRKAYDSTDDTDDTIPSDKTYSEKDFYAVFGAVFKKNSKWSLIKPVPQLGDDLTTDAEVISFYNFWYGFKTWREMAPEEMYDIDEATCREERRWMNKENEKKTTKLRKEEAKRIWRLAELAHKKDPRVIKMKQREIEERERLKKEKSDRKKELLRQRELERIALENERKRILEEEQRQKEEAEKEKLRAREQIETIVLKSRKVPEELNWALNNVVVQFEEGELHTLVQMQEKSVIEFVVKKVDEYIKKKKADEEKYLSRNVLDEWSSADVELFKKGCKKYPQGTERRYGRIAMYMKTKNEFQVIEYAKALNAKMHSKEEQKEEVLEWEKEQQIALQNAIKELAGYKGSDKWDKIALKVTGKTKKQCIERVQYLKKLANERKMAN